MDKQLDEWESLQDKLLKADSEIKRLTVKLREKDTLLSFAESTAEEAEYRAKKERQARLVAEQAVSG